MSAFRLTPWKPKDAPAVRRIYVQGPGLYGQSWLELSGNILRLKCDGGAEAPPSVLADLYVFLGTQGFAPAMFEPAHSRALWVALCEFRPRPLAATGARASSLRAPTQGLGADRRSDPSEQSKLPAQYSDESHLDAASITVEGPIHILVDHREPAAIVEELRRAAHVTVEIAALESGDYVLNGRVLVERKTVADFEASIVGDNRLFLQSEKMKLDPEHLGVLLLEGDVFRTAARMSIPQITGAISYLGMIQGLSIVPSLGPRHTAYLLVKMAAHQAHGLGYELGLRSDKPEALLDAQCFLLEGLPGVSTGLARELLRHFGTVRAVVNASEAQLREVSGVGPKRAKSILAVLASPSPATT